jgi:hypothetical protein
MDPFVAYLGTLFANVFGGRSDFDLVDVSASFVHGFSLACRFGPAAT